MGFFSYKCKECGHPMLSHGAVDKGINERVDGRGRRAHNGWLAHDR
jgi:hypothetical protein